MQCHYLLYVSAWHQCLYLTQNRHNVIILQQNNMSLYHIMQCHYLLYVFAYS